MPIQISLSNAIGALQGLAGGGPGPGPGPGYTPPLDAYPADIAYSVRKLSSSYTGPAIEVERNPGGETQDIYFDSNGLVDTTALATFAAGAELRVKTFYDQTGNGRHATTTVSTDMSYIYSGTAVYEANEIPVVTPRGATDGFYNITGTYSTAANNTVFAVLSAGHLDGSYLMARGAFGSSGILMAGIACPTGGCTSGPDYGFGTTQYYRDGVYYGGTGTGLTRDDFAQSSISSQRIYGVGFTQSGLNAINMSRAGNSSIYATQEYIVYFSDQLGTTPRQALEQNLNSYYRSSNLPDYTSGFLADYTGAAAAYSVRKLSNTAIKCMRVRRAVAPFDEKDIGFTAGGDLDEAAIVAFGGSDVLNVSAWYDQSGQSRHATQIAPNSQPQIYNGTAVLTENGKPYLKFRGGNGGNESLNMNSEVTCETIFSVVGNDAPGFLAYYLWNSAASLGFFSGGTFSSPTPILGPGVATGAVNGFITGTETGQTLLYNDYNGTGWEVGQDGGTATDVLTISAQTINQIVRPNTNLQVEKAQEFIIYGVNRSDERTAIEDNIMTYYQIP